jgi:hypothetical protein
MLSTEAHPDPLATAGMIPVTREAGYDDEFS